MWLTSRAAESNTSINFGYYIDVMMSTITSKGQVTIPKNIRDYMGLKPGSAVEFEIAPDGRAIVQPARVAGVGRRRPLDSLRGTLDTGMTTDELMSLLRGYDDDAADPGFQ